MLTELHAHVVTTLDEFTLDVELRASPGVTVLFGPSGAGKTSVLRALAGLISLRSGFVRFGDANWTQLPPEQRAIGYVFQSSALFPHLNVEENVRFGAPSSDAAAKWIERLRLGALASRKPSSLSGGEAQRVALARALARNPRVLLLDEPFSSLDEASRDELLLEVKSVVESERLVTMLVTHDRAEGERFGGTFVPMNDGRVKR